MSDPFRFDPARIERRPLLRPDGGLAETLAYQTPLGEISKVSEYPGEFSDNVVVFYMRMSFDQMVHDLTAHQRLDWLAAARARS